MDLNLLIVERADGGLPLSRCVPLQPGPAYLRPSDAAQRDFNLRRSMSSSVAAAAGRPCGKLAPGIVRGTVAAWGDLLRWLLRRELL